MIEKCLSSYNHCSFNLIERPDVIDALKSASERNIDIFVSRISLLAGRKLEKGKTIVFIDEIQQYSEILTAVKFLIKEGSYRYILSGSLLGAALTGIKSAPVGYLSTLHMFPLDFHEFLVALNVQPELVALLRECYEKKKPVDDTIHRKLIEIYYLYLVVGGMPAAVQRFIDSGDFMEVSAVHENIIEQYKVDFTKYEKEQKLKLIGAYDLIPAELNKKNKRFIFTDLDRNLRFERYESSFIWLSSAGVAIPVFNTLEPSVPLEINRQNNLFKLFLSDVGLLSTFYGNAAKLKLIDGGEDINCGAVFENAVAQELLSKRFRLYYYNSKKKGEVDFIIEHDGKCLPIEVKSGKDYSIHSALNNLLSNPGYDIPTAFVLSKGNVKDEGRVVYLPVYMTMFIEETALPEAVKVPDLSSLLKTDTENREKKITGGR